VDLAGINFSVLVFK